jgi:TetR/AcrR family transcriptional repressor of nem operon
MSEHLEKYFDNISNAIGHDDAKDLAMSVMCMMVGAVTLSRVMSDPAISDKLLFVARKAILELGERSGAE